MMLTCHCKLSVQRVQKPASRLIDHGVVATEGKRGQQCRTGRVCEWSSQWMQRAHAIGGSEGNNAQLAYLQARQSTRYAGQRLQRQCAAVIFGHATRVIQCDDNLQRQGRCVSDSTKPMRQKRQATKCIQKRSSSSGYQKQN